MHHAKRSATAGTQAAQLERLSGETQRVLQLECQLANWRGAAVAESQTAQVQLASLRAALLSQAVGLQFKGAAATAAGRESSWLDCWFGELHALQIATGQASRVPGKTVGNCRRTSRATGGFER